MSGLVVSGDVDSTTAFVSVADVYGAWSGCGGGRHDCVSIH